VSRGPAPIHGGDLGEAAALLGEDAGAEAGWIDLSTGINPVPYPLPPLEPKLWARLPQSGAQETLIATAARYYGVPQGAALVAAPGSEALIHVLPDLLPAGRTAIVGPTYSEHARSWGRGSAVSTVDSADAAVRADVVVVVNPNNPDGLVVPLENISDIASIVSKHGGWLVIDEAFADVVPGASAVGLAADRNVVVLRSFGKFFGLAGLRLGFAVAPPDLSAKLRHRLGPWPISGPAIAIGTKALADREWQAASLDRLSRDARALDAVLRPAGFEIVGGTPLFQLAAHDRAEEMFFRLLKAGVYVRRFNENRRWLRFGVPEGPQALKRLEAALSDREGGRP
jgi:cobalamin biosynthesis protein CobC